MKYFLEMVEHVQRTGLIFYLDEGKRTVSTKPFFDLVEKAENLVFLPKNKEPKQMGGDVYVKCDAPFSVYSIEVLGGNVTEPSGFRASYKRALEIVSAATDEERRDILGDTKDVGVPGEIETAVPAWIHCLLAYELEPNKFAYYVYCTYEDRKMVFSTNTMDRVAKEFMDRLSREEMGVHKIRQRVKVGNGKEKRIHTVRRVVYVKPKSAPREVAPIGGGTIDWTHRWAVRGHWVSLPGRLGKDRAGNYCVHGSTWRSEHEKGPEDAPLIKKTRVIE